MVVFWVEAFIGIATIVGVGDVVVKFAVIAGSKKKLGFIKVLIPSKFISFLLRYVLTDLIQTTFAVAIVTRYRCTGY